MPPDRCLLDIPVSHTVSRARQAMLENNELQPIITALVLCFCGGVGISWNFVCNGILIGFKLFFFNELNSCLTDVHWIAS